MNKLLQLIIIFALLSGLSLLNGCRYIGANAISPAVNNGVLDLRNWDFKRDGIVDLSGPWRFYWKQYLLPGSDFNSIAKTDYSLIQVPGAWNGHNLNGTTISGDGFGTYQLRILVSPLNKHLAFEILDMATAYQVYVNGSLLHASGIPGKTFETATPYLSPKVLNFNSDSNHIDVLVHVSNFHHRLGGMWESIKLGNINHIRTRQEKANWFNFFLLGSIIIMGLYHIGLYWNRKDDKTSLYFGIFCILMGARLLSTGQRSILHLMPGMNFESLYKIIYVSFYLCVPVFAGYLKTLFPREISNKVFSVSLFISLVLTVLVILTPASVYSYTMPGFQLLTVLLLCYGMLAVMVAVWRKRNESIVFLFGFLVLFTTSLNDILYTRQIIDTGHFFQTGFFIFLFSQAYIISKRFTAAFSIIEEQRHDLEASNTDYQKELKDRKNAEKKYRILAENVNDVIWTMDLDLNYTYLSPAIERMQGWTAKEVASLTVNDLLTPHSIEIAVKRLENHIAYGTKTGDYNISDTLELELYRKDGSTILAEVVASAILDEDGKLIGILGVTRDITERKELETQLQRSQKMESVGLLAGGVAHDLNNVLAGIVSYPELILMDLPADSELREPIETMQDSGFRATAIVQDLLTVARGVAVVKEPLNLNDLVCDYLDSPEFEKVKQFNPTVTVRTHLANDLRNVNGSYVHIRKVVMNLVANASEAIKDKGRVTVSTVSRYVEDAFKGYERVDAGEYAVLEVSDNGSGISPHDLKRIFEPFYTKKVMGRSGTGLGLAVVWNTVQDHNGYIDVTSDKNGTTFKLYFPVTKNAVPDKELPIPVKDYQGNGETLLVVDDVDSQREISCKMLESLGYRTYTVASGEEAVEFVKENSLDLLLIDMIMDPGINGRETYTRVLKIQPNQKAIIVSGYAETDEVRATQKLGAGRYVKKPLTLEKLGLAVKAELEK